MNGMNKAIVGVVFGIALAYAALSLLLTAQHLLDTGAVSMFLFLPHGDEMGVDLSEYVGPIVEAYDAFLGMPVGSITDDAGMQDTVTLIFVMIGFILAAAGMFTRPVLDTRGTENPAEYLWTHRPKAFAWCLAAPWGLIPGCWAKHKALVLIPVVLLPFYAVWSLLIMVFLVVPFALMKGIVSIRIRSAAKKEGAAYERSTQFAVCPKCKRNFERPKIKCRCGLDLDYPVPNVYGIKYHTCNNGHRIPCTAGKRGELRTVCPYCGQDIETREAMPVNIAMVGAVGSGKTTMMLAAVGTIEAAARTRDVTVEAVTPGISKQAVLAKDVAPRTPAGELDTECLFLRSMSMRDKEVLISDISGQEFEPREGKTLFQEYYNYSDGIVFAFDPTAFSRQRRGATPMEVFESFAYMFSQITGAGPSRPSRVPLAIVATKNDIMNPPLDDGGVRRFLEENGQGDFVRLAEAQFPTVRYFAVRSLGKDCGSAARPFWWIVSQTDAELGSAVPIDLQ